jgi:iron(III) transport system permease protein
MYSSNLKQKHIENKQVQFSPRTCLFLFKNIWSKIWQGNDPDLILLILGFLTSIMMAFPIFYVAWRSLFAGKARWMRLLDSRIPRLLWNTLTLASAVTVLALIIGVSLAWLLYRYHLPGGRIWQWLLALPLLIPPYVGAMSYVIILGPRGWTTHLFGFSPLNIYSFSGVVFVLTLFTYPYVLLITSASLKKMNGNYEEAARSLGLTPGEIFWKVYFPLLRPAMGAGAVLVFLYVLSDFGAVAMLRYSTFTSAIYYQMGSYDNLSATVLSVILIFITIIVITLESWTRRKQRYYQTSHSSLPADKYFLGAKKIPVLTFSITILLFSFILPIIVLVYWSRFGLTAGALDRKFWLYAWNSIKVAGLASIFSMVLALPIIYLKSRYPSNMTLLMNKLCYSGYALPGVIVALGIIFIFNRYIPWLYNTFYLVAFACIIRFLPQAMQSGEASLDQVAPRIDEAARSLGYNPIKVLSKVIVPLILPGVLSGGALVFVNSIKELPATLLLRPPGFDTISVRIWVETSESIYHMAAPGALLIVLLSIVPLKLLLSKN